MLKVLVSGMAPVNGKRKYTCEGVQPSHGEVVVQQHDVLNKSVSSHIRKAQVLWISNTCLRWNQTPWRLRRRLGPCETQLVDVDADTKIWKQHLIRLSN